jgi:hypothetical protein
VSSFDEFERRYQGALGTWREVVSDNGPTEAQAKRLLRCGRYFKDDGLQDEIVAAQSVPPKGESHPRNSEKGKGSRAGEHILGVLEDEIRSGRGR